MFSDVSIFAALHVICPVAVVKSIHKNLIHDRPFCPVRCGKSRSDHKRIEIFPVTGYAAAVEIIHFPSAANPESIVKFLLSQLPFDLVIIKDPSRFLFLHRAGLITGKQKYLINIIFCCPETQENLFIFLWFRRYHIIARTVAEQCVYIHKENLISQTFYSVYSPSNNSSLVIFSFSNSRSAHA